MVKGAGDTQEATGPRKGRVEPLSLPLKHLALPLTVQSTGRGSFPGRNWDFGS